jgi:hypothetical protein
LIGWLKHERTLKQKIAAGLVFGVGLCAVYGCWSYLFRYSHLTATSACLCVIDPDCGDYEEVRGPPIGGKGAGGQAKNEASQRQYFKVNIRCDSPYIAGEQLLATMIGFFMVSISSKRVATK